MSRALFVISYYLLNVIIANDVFSIVVTMPIFLIIMFNVFRIKDANITCSDIFWFVCFIFFVIGPIQTLDGNSFSYGSPVYGVIFDDDDIIVASVSISLFLLFYTFVDVKLSGISAPSVDFRFENISILTVVAVNLLSFGLFIYASGGVSNMLMSRYLKEAVEADQGFAIVPSLSLLIISALVSVVKFKRETRSVSLLLCLAICLFTLFLAQNPYNTARNFLVQIWVPIILIFVNGRIPVLFSYICIFAFLFFIMPILNITSREGGTLLDALSFLKFDSNFIKIPYVDVFDMMAMEVKWFHSHDLFFGEKTLGLILFLFPRSIWEGKATLIGLDIGNYLYNAKIAGTPNLSLFVAGDFYADFGVLGAAVGGGFSAFIAFLTFFKRRTTFGGYPIKEWLLLGAFPILIRGPFAANAALIVLNLVVLLLLLPKISRRNNGLLSGHQVGAIQSGGI